MTDLISSEAAAQFGNAMEDIGDTFLKYPLVISPTKTGQGTAVLGGKKELKSELVDDAVRQDGHDYFSFKFAVGVLSVAGLLDASENPTFTREWYVIADTKAFRIVGISFSGFLDKKFFCTVLGER